MIEITNFLLKHLYELMADDYSAGHNERVATIGLLSADVVVAGSTVRKETTTTSQKRELRHHRKQQHSKRSHKSRTEPASNDSSSSIIALEDESGDEELSSSNKESNVEQTLANQSYLNERVTTTTTITSTITHSSREQETNQQIVSFLANNHLPDLFCETFIELLFICVFLAISWIFVMIVQLHCHQLQQPARLFYCNTKFLASLMYCNSKHHLAAS